MLRYSTLLIIFFFLHFTYSVFIFCWWTTHGSILCHLWWNSNRHVKWQKDKEFNVCFVNFYWDVGPSLFMYTYVYVGLRSSLMSRMKCDWAAIVLFGLLSQDSLLFPGSLAAVTWAKLLQIKLHCLAVLAASGSECELGLRLLSLKSALQVHRNLSNDSEQL